METDRMNEDWAKEKSKALALGISLEEIEKCIIPEDIAELVKIKTNLTGLN